MPLAALLSPLRWHIDAGSTGTPLACRYSFTRLDSQVAPLCCMQVPPKSSTNSAATRRHLPVLPASGLLSLELTAALPPKQLFLKIDTSTSAT